MEPSGPQKVAVPLETKDQQKFNKARRLGKNVGEVRDEYREHLKSKNPKKCQGAVALYFIDKLVFRSGHKKKKGDKSESAGCCLLRKKHVKLHGKNKKQKFVVEFDFLGKDSIPYHKLVYVNKIVYENLTAFLKGKSDEDYIFDLIDANYLNTRLKKIMVGLTARVFRTYHASQMMQKQLAELTSANDEKPKKLRSFIKANNEVAIFLNHKLQVAQRGTKKKEKLKTKEEKKEYETGLETSIMYYIDPRIVVAWCRKWNVPIKDLYPESLLEKFSWAMSAKADYKF